MSEGKGALRGTALEGRRERRLEFLILKRHFFGAFIVFWKFELKIVGFVREKAKLTLLMNFKGHAKKQLTPFPFFYYTSDTQILSLKIS